MGERSVGSIWNVGTVHLPGSFRWLDCATRAESAVTLKVLCMRLDNPELLKLACESESADQTAKVLVGVYGIQAALCTCPNWIPSACSVRVVFTPDNTEIKQQGLGLGAQE